MVDFGDALSANPEPLSLFATPRLISHYNAEGYRLLGREIAQALRGRPAGAAESRRPAAPREAWRAATASRSASPAAR